MNEASITSVAQFHELLRQLGFTSETRLLYRGQSDASWPVDCSAARRLNQDAAESIEPQDIHLPLIGYLEFLLATSKMRGFIAPGVSKPFIDLELLAHLQHQRAATGLIDFTRRPLVALWFACNGSYEKDGAIHVLPRSKTEEIRNPEDLEKKIEDFYVENKLWSWEPSGGGNRIVAQSSIFIFGAPVISPNNIDTVAVQANKKKGILTELENVYGINEETLFPDFPGYAEANAHNKPFDIQRTIHYWRDQIKDDERAAQDHLNCGRAYGAIKDYKNAIEQYDEAIRLNPQYAEAYY